MKFSCEPILVDLRLKIPANFSEAVYFEFSKNNKDTAKNKWEVWETSTINKKTVVGNNNNYFVEYSQQYTLARFDSENMN